jgi:ABC-type transport system involved in multi-copper enzyme maturation permease subunit
VSRTRIRAIIRKELREYRRNRSIVVTMAVLPLIFLVQPLLEILSLGASSASSLAGKEPLIYLLAVPAIVPGALAAYAVVGERTQGTLEPVLTTPIRREEFLLGKALAVLIPTLVISYVVLGVAAGVFALFSDSSVASMVLRGPEVLAVVLFTPLLSAWSIWVAIAISTRASEVRVAQQLSVVTALPAIAVTTLISVGVIHATNRLAFGLAALLLVADSRGWRIVARLFDRERLITGRRS